jgi:hypothetical protein
MVLERFGEDERINIQNLALETETQSPELKFNVADYFSETDFAHLREDLSAAEAANNWDSYCQYNAQLKLLLPQIEPPFKFDSHQRRSIMITIRDHGGINNWHVAALRYADLRILFPEHADNIKPLSDSWGHMLIAGKDMHEKDMEAYYDLVLAVKIINPPLFDAQYLDDDMWPDLKDRYEDSLIGVDNFTVRYLFLAKALFPEKVDELEFSPQIWEKMKNSLRAWKSTMESQRAGGNKLSSWYPFLSTAGQMRFIAAGDIKVTDRGLESVPRRKQKDLTSAHNLPVSRNF